MITKDVYRINSNCNSDCDLVFAKDAADAAVQCLKALTIQSRKDGRKKRKKDVRIFGIQFVGTMYAS